MTNSFSLPLAGNNARVEPDAFITSRDISNADNQLGKIGRLQNYAFAYHATGPIITQHFEDGVFYYSGTSRVACRWRIPAISANHKTIKITLHGQGTSGNALFTLSNASSSNTKNFAFNSQKFDQGSIALASVTSEYSLLTLTVSGAIQLDYVCIEYLPLSSPLAEIAVDAVYTNGFFYPIGDDSFLADEPLSAGMGQMLTNNIRVLQRRPRMLFSMSGIDLPETTSNPILGKTVRPQKGLTINDIFALNTAFIVWGNYNRLGMIYKVMMYVENFTAYDFSFKIYSQDITITSGTIPQWIEYDLRTIFNQGGIDQFLSMPLIRFNLNPQVGAFFTTASPILSISFWGA